jgi:hypothetical protein
MAMVGAQQRARGTVEMGGSEREAERDGRGALLYRCREFLAAPPWLRKRVLLCCHQLPVL